MVYDYHTEAEALADVREEVAVNGFANVAAWVLLRDEDPDGDTTVIAEGAALATYAQETVAAD